MGWAAWPSVSGRPYPPRRNARGLLRQEGVEAAGRGEGKESAERLLAAQGDGGLDHVLQRSLSLGLQPPPRPVGDASALGGFELRPAQGDAARLDAAGELTQDLGGRL